MSRAAELAPDDASVRGNLGQAFLLGGRNREAVGAAREGVSAGPGAWAADVAAERPADRGRGPRSTRRSGRAPRASAAGERTLSSVAIAGARARAGPAASSAGRSFRCTFDYLVVGGGLSLALTAYLLWAGGFTSAQLQAQLPALILLSNSAHFAASTVRLYSRGDSFQSFPFLTMVLPVVSIAVLSGAILAPGTLGQNLQALYLTWSPYHYAAQAYGLALMYAYRSGSTLVDSGKGCGCGSSCLAPFCYAFRGRLRTAGLGWLALRVLGAPRSWRASGAAAYRPSGS